MLTGESGCAEVQIDGEQRKLLKSVRANEEGRVTSNLLEGETLKVARYELVFHVSEYYKRIGVTQTNPEFLDVVPLRFAKAVPSPWLSRSMLMGRRPAGSPAETTRPER